MRRITSADDPAVAGYRNLPDRDLRDEGRYVGESPLVVEKMLGRPGEVLSVLVAEKHRDWALARVPDDVPVFEAGNEVMGAIAGFRFHRGVLALGRRPPPDELTVDALLRAVGGSPDAAAPPGDAGGRPLALLLVDGVNNTDNLGLLFRNAAAFAVDGIVLGPGTHDPLYRRVLRVSIGHVLTVRWARSQDWAADLAAIKRTAGVRVLGASADPSAKPLDAVVPPPRFALVVGAEYAGLSAAASDTCDERVRVPMAPGVDSLNVGVASAVCLHRLVRTGRA